MNLRVWQNPWRLMLAVNAAVLIGVFVHKISLPPYVPYIHLLVDYHFGFTKRALVGAAVALFTAKVPVLLVFALAGVIWLITLGLFAKLFQRTFGFDEKHLPLFVFMTNGNGAPQEGAPPQLNVLAQYTKDLSFENPNAPSSLQQQQQQPSINIQINVSANNIAQNEFEVTLHIDGKAENGGKVLFSFDLAYAGVFRIVNVPQENLHPLVMAHFREW